MNTKADDKALATMLAALEAENNALRQQLAELKDARREAFEAWFESLNHFKPDKSIGPQTWWYSDERVSDAWQAWNAALDSICVELPFDTYGCMGADKVKEALAATGVPYK